MSKHITLLSILSISILLTAGCGDYLDLEPDEPPSAPPDAAPPDAAPGPLPGDAGPGYPQLPPPQVFPDEPVVTTPGAAPAPPAADVDDGVHLVFPPAVSLTTARHVTMRGTARLAGGVTAVRVNGVDARLSPPNAEGAVAWQADVQVTLGRSELVVSSVAGNGTITPAAASASLTFSPDMLVSAGVMALDEGHDRLFVSDHDTGFVAIDLEAGVPTSMRLAETADGPVFPYSLSIDAAAGRAMALFQQSTCPDDFLHRVMGTISIDLHDGSAEVEEETLRISDCDYLEDAPDIDDRAVVLDTGRGSFYYLRTECDDDGDDCHAEVRRRRLDAGGPLPPDVPLCASPDCGALDMIADRRSAPAGVGLLALVREGTGYVDNSYDIRAIDPAAGTQARIVTVQIDWDGTALRPYAMALDAAGDRLFVLATSGSSDLYVIGIDLATGAQSLLFADVASVDGRKAWYVSDVVHDPRRDRLIFAGSGRGLIALDLGTGAASLLLRPSIGEGPVPCGNSGCAFSTFDSSRQRFFVYAYDDRAGDIYVVDVATGNRRLLSPRGSTIEFGGTPRLFADDVEDRLLVVHDNRGLYTVDGATGERRYVGVVPAVDRAGMAWDPERNRILYTSSQDGYALRSFDVDTAQIRVISSDTVGSGPSLRGSLVTLDASRTRAFVSDIDGRSLLGVDLTTGDRTSYAVGEPVARPAEPTGPQPVLPDVRRNRILVGELPKHAIGAIDLSTGTTDLFVDRFHTAPPLRGAVELIPDHANDRALIVDGKGDVQMLDLQTGQRVLLLQSQQ